MTNHLSSFLGMALLVCAGTQAAFADESAYPINYPKDATINTQDRVLNGVELNTSDGAQSITVGQLEDQLLYHDLTNHCFTALSGDRVTASFDWVGGWMHGYVYLDRKSDGKYDALVGENGAIPENSDVMAFSFYAGFNSDGHEPGNNPGVNPPAFTLPDLEPGLYRMRYKIDWNSIDPGGNDENGEIHQQTIIANRGAIADVMLYIHDAQNEISVISPHGKVFTAQGEPIEDTTAPSGKSMKMVVVPDAGYVVGGVTIENGYEIDLPEGVTVAGDGLEWTTTEIPLHTIINNEVTVPAQCTVGNMKITVTYLETGVDSADDYACKLSGTKAAADGFTKLTLTSGDKAATVSSADISTDKRHYFHSSAVLHADCSADIVPTFEFAGESVPVHFYIDFNHDGAFVGAMGEEVAAAKSDATMEALKLPATFTPGVYRARLEADGVAAVDFMLNLHKPTCTIYLDIENGYVVGAENHGLAGSLAYGEESLVLTPRAVMPGFTATKLTLRHGQNLNGPQEIRGNRQWNEIELPVGESSTIDASAIDGDIMVTGAFEPTDDCNWEQIWGDEFNGTELDMEKWSYHPRYTSVWNRYIAKGDECPVVNVIGDGVYTAYCMPTPAEFKDTEKEPMISGAIYTSGKFYCLNGWVEARAKTLPHRGNFPAFWMMPITSMKWPTGGEIDIWEQINTEQKAYHTIHSAWANPNEHDLGKPEQPSPAKGGSSVVDPAEWHVYALEWTQEALKFYVDGELKFTYNNMHYTDPIYTEYLSWPFSKPFYIICNQSVGNGSWAGVPDYRFTYHTEFDYVRVYQKKDNLDYYSKADGKVSGLESVIVDSEEQFNPDEPCQYYNLQGMRVSDSNLAPGVYIIRQGSITKKQYIKP